MKRTSLKKIHGIIQLKAFVVSLLLTAMVCTAPRKLQLVFNRAKHLRKAYMASMLKKELRTNLGS